jgi:hypothetical protein
VGARALTGVTLLGWPRHALTAVSGQAPGDRAELYARVLGVRHLAEAAILWRWTTPAVLRAGAAVDAVHGASSVVLVGMNDRRRLAALNVASAATWASLGLAVARTVL